MVCKMVKKGVVGAALGAGALALLFGTAAPRYVKTAFHKVRNSADDTVPIQFKIDAARQEVADLEPAIHQNIESTVKAEVEIENLKAEIAATEENLKHEGRAIASLRDHLATGDLHLTGSAATFTPDEVKGELARRFDHYKNVKQILATKQETLKQREKGLLAARQQLDQMKAAKAALLTKLEGIETRLQQIEATRAANEYNFDDSALARAKQTVSELSKRVEVMARMAEREGRYTDQGLALPIEPGRDIVKEVDAEFGTPANTPGASTADRSL